MESLEMSSRRSGIIIKALLEIQGRHGYLPREELEFLALRADVPLCRIEEVTTFFPHFRREKPADVTIHICQSMTCHLRGAGELLGKAQEFANASQPATVAVEGVSCLGRCDRAPVAIVNRQHAGENGIGDHLYTRLGDRRSLESLLKDIIAGGEPKPDTDRDHGEPPSWQIDVYSRGNSAPGPEPYAAVREFLEGPLDAEWVLAALEDADLVGMGGAAARTGKKWREVSKARKESEGDCFIICNADESEPGTFKDRELLLRVPHLVIEGMLLAGLSVRATRGYIYVRHEYHEQIAVLRAEIENARQRVPMALELCPLEVFVSPGLYICGEESALIEVIEGKRAQPRNQPPDIRNNGLFDRPTLVNNVETYAWMPAILRNKAEWFRDQPLRFFSVSGDVERPGVFEAPWNWTLGQLIATAGGLRFGMQLHAVAPSGPSGGFLPAQFSGDWICDTLDRGIPGLVERCNEPMKENKRPSPQADRVKKHRERFEQFKGKKMSVLELPLDVAVFRTLRLSLGAGIVVYGTRPGEQISMLDHAANCLEFFHKESCGKCVPCRLGCEQLTHLAHTLRDTNDDKRVAVQGVVAELAQVMKSASICGLGRAASTPLTTWLTHFGRRSST